MRNIAYLAAVVVAVATGAQFAFQLSRAGQVSFVLWIGVPTVVIAAIALVRARRDGELSSWLSVRGGDFSRGFVSAALLFGGSWLFARLVAPVGSARESWLARLYLQLGDPKQLRDEVAFVVVGIVIMAAAEEIVWRGLVTSLLAEQIGSRRAWVWAAVLYALAHVPTVWALRDPVAGPNPVIILGALAAGLVWGGLARRYERLLPSIFSHALFDWTVLMMFRLWGPSV